MVIVVSPVRFDFSVDVLDVRLVECKATVVTFDEAVVRVDAEVVRFNELVWLNAGFIEDFVGKDVLVNIVVILDKFEVIFWND